MISVKALTHFILISMVPSVLFRQIAFTISFLFSHQELLSLRQYRKAKKFDSNFHLIIYRKQKVSHNKNTYAPIFKVVLLSITKMSSIGTWNKQANTTKLSIVGMVVPCCHL